MGLREQKVVDGVAQPVGFVTHSLDHLLLVSMEHMVYTILERQFQIKLLIYQYRVTVKSCIDKFKKKVQNVSTLIEAV
jgi:hypothetical protein